MFGELILLRHAKSAWPVGVSDAQRPLSARGIRDARAFGTNLRAAQRQVDVAIVSTAERTRETWSLVAEEAGLSAEAASFDARLYAASWWDVMDVVRGLPDTARTALIVGHNPSLEDLAGQIANSESDTTAMKELRAKFPTCAAAYLRGDAQWSHWGGQCASLVDLWTPRLQSRKK